MSDEFDSLELPEELRDVASRLRGLRPATAVASEAECMYRAGWQAALASQSAPKAVAAVKWNSSFLGGLVSGAVVSGSLAAALMIGMVTSSSEPEAVPASSQVAQESFVPAAPVADALAAQPATEEPDQTVHSRPPETKVVPVRTVSDEVMATALLSPMARRQWREILTQSAAPYASPWNGSAPAAPPTTETLRSSPHDIDHTWF